MAVFRVSKDKNYSVVSNYYLRNRNLSLEAIGLLTIVLSLPNNFKFSIENLVKMTSENYRTIKLLIRELKNNGYLVISKKKDDKGQYYYEYIWFESNSLNPEYAFRTMEQIDTPSNTSNNTISPKAKNEPMDSVNSNNNYKKNEENPEVISPMLVKEPLLDINTNNIKINIDKTKLNLCWLTEYLIDWNFIDLNDINLFSYDFFLVEFLKEDEVRTIVNIVNYVVKRIMNNNYLDEENKPIYNLYTYFKESCRHNLACIKAQNDPHLFDDWY